MKLTPEEREKLIKGVPVEHLEDKDTSWEAGLDKDDCLERIYPDVSKK
ncbi:hypothetical protein [Bacillus sp. T3]|nr:hypothetical protein [Bacillus sp. T3]